MHSKVSSYISLTYLLKTNLQLLLVYTKLLQIVFIIPYSWGRIFGFQFDFTRNNVNKAKVKQLFTISKPWGFKYNLVQLIFISIISFYMYTYMFMWEYTNGLKTNKTSIMINFEDCLTMYNVSISWSICGKTQWKGKSCIKS